MSVRLQICMETRNVSLYISDSHVWLVCSLAQATPDCRVTCHPFNWPWIASPSCTSVPHFANRNGVKPSTSTRLCCAISNLSCFFLFVFLLFVDFWLSYYFQILFGLMVILPSLKRSLVILRVIGFLSKKATTTCTCSTQTHSSFGVLFNSCLFQSLLLGFIDVCYVLLWHFGSETLCWLNRVVCWAPTLIPYGYCTLLLSRA